MLLQFLVLSACVFVILKVLKPRSSVLQNYFVEPSSAFNLGVFRAVVFGAILYTFNLPQVVWFSKLPKALQEAPFPWKPILPHLPIEPGISQVLGILFIAFCILAILGVLTRVSAWAVVILGIYLLGIPQFYGKVNHYHHLLWFAFLMAVYPSGHGFSVDNLIKKRENVSSQIYGVPIRIAWLLMGIVYFTAGFAKIYHGGAAWVFSDNLHNQMLMCWYEKGWDAFGIPVPSWLMKLGGLFTLGFELSFVFLILFKKTRAIAAITGILFHNSTWLFLGIPFIPLQLMYLSFINWKKGGIGEGDPSPVGYGLVWVQGVIGLMGVMMAWPFAAYPTFQGVKRDTTHTEIAFDLKDESGQVTTYRPFLDRRLLDDAGPERWNGLSQQIIESKDEVKAKALIRVVEPYLPFKPVSTDIYVNTVSVLPAESGKVLRREKLVSIN